jgi:hypothetical protein
MTKENLPTIKTDCTEQDQYKVNIKVSSYVTAK